MAKTKLKEKAIKLRVGGKSYNEISARLNVSKSTLSCWLSKIKLTHTQKARLAKKMKLSGVRSGETRSAQWQQQRKILHAVAVKKHTQVRLSLNSLALVGAALYWAEGAKRGSMRFCNSDAKMIQLYLLWLDKILGVLDEDITYGVNAYINVGISKKAIRRYWGKVVGVEWKRVKVYPTIAPKSSKQTKIGRLPFGTMYITLKNPLEYRAQLDALLLKLGKDTMFVAQPQSHCSTKVVL